MALKFGQTWWGQQWLKAFNGIDFSNRLPRGQRYARNGSVAEIEITPSFVKAKVRGRRPSPYRVSISLSLFNSSQQNSIIRAVQQNPAILSRLLNRQLPAQMLPLLEQKRIKLFPASWNEMEASCSCPDWAVPCKHIAAVIYLLASEIDKNPFMVFTLHGMDLVDTLERQTGLAVPTLEAPPLSTDPWSDEAISEPIRESEKTASFDLTLIPSLQERLFGILTPEPLFYSGDFRNQMQLMYKRMAKEALRYAEVEQNPWPEAEQVDVFTAVVDDSGTLVDIRSDTDAGLAKHPASRSHCRAGALLLLLHSIQAAQEPRLSPAMLLWSQLYRLAVKLVQQSAFVPKVLTSNSGQTLIQWRPATLCPEVRSLLTPLYQQCPKNLILLRTDDSNQGTYYASGETQIDTALHILISGFAQMAWRKAPEKLTQDEILALFFNQSPQDFTSFVTSEHPQVIQHWLSRLTLAEREHQICLFISADEDPEWLEVSVSISHKGELTPLKELLDRGKVHPCLISVLADLAILADYFPDLETLYGEAPKSSLGLSLEAFTPIFSQTLPALKMLGIQVCLPKALQKLAYPRLNLSLAAKPSDNNPSYMNLDQLLRFNWQVALGDQRVSVTEFKQLTQKAEGLIYLFEQYVMMDDRRLQTLLTKLDKLPESLSRIQLLKAGLAGELDGASVDLGEGARKLFNQLLTGKPAPLPDGLEATLRPYQQRGFEWMVQNARIGFGSLLADDMGLGKTLQVIALLLHQKENQQLAQEKGLIIAPTSLLTNWRKELERFAPTLKTQIYHGSKRSLKVDDHDLILTSYGLARSDYKTLSKFKWRTLVIDEAQNIKNPGARQTKTIKQYDADIRVAMSGTPVENRLGEYWSLFDFTNKGYLDSQKAFTTEFARPIEAERDQHALDRFRKITAPFIMRRVKTDKTIINDLPEKIEGNRFCTLSKAQTALYQTTVDNMMMELAVEEGIQRQGMVLKLLNALKQICNSPAQYLNHTAAEIPDSGKLDAFIEIMKELEATEEKALIFTQYTTMGDLLVKALHEELGLTVPFLHGGLSRKQRDEMVEGFQNDRRTRAMILSLKAGGTGLNLTAASQVIHYDLWWNPAVEAQATDRAYRIGQNQRVQVHRLITANTLEEKIDQMIQDKKELAELTVASGEKWITQLSNQELRELVALS